VHKTSLLRLPAAVRQELHLCQQTVGLVVPLSNTTASSVNMATDASSKGFGAVASFEGRLHYLAGSWTPLESQLHINALEILAVAKAISAWNLTNTSITIAIDNTTAIAAISKRFSGSFMIYEAISSVLVKSRNNDFSCVYIPSGKNPADSLSRGAPVDSAKVSEWINQQPVSLTPKHMDPTMLGGVSNFAYRG